MKFHYAGDGHNHWHFTDFDDYWIETLGGTDLRSAEKHGYCLEDNTTWAGLAGAAGVPTSPVYLGATSCGKGLPQALTVIEGLSRGWGDTYPLTLPDQAIDVTGLPDGRYRVGITADALGAVVEGDESNNTATMEISISGNTVTTYPATATGGLN
ncbi:lysyl oxidase family protein [Nocardioides rubriscoriae]|uniref:lysyl oxidase family protein n=1 Tax=Nocardioides rubriscoriae TaxID=642762 RepID=UPI0014789EAF|nr:lysyl oxidase family protein [Nocardioides rubriscoriae]